MFSMFKRIPGAMALKLAFAFALASVLAMACSTASTVSNPNQVPSTSAASNTGSIGMNLVTPNGTQLFAVTWSLTGSGGAPSYPGGTVNISDAGIAGNVEFVVGGIAATGMGQSYTMTITGYDTNNDPCSGTSAPFGVVADADTYVLLSVTCVVATDAATATINNTGSVQVDAAINYVQQDAFACPGISSVSILPALGEVGGPPLALAVTTIGGDVPPTFVWSTNAPAGSLTSTTGASTVFECLATGTWQITAQAEELEVPIGSDADVNVCQGVAYTTITALANCDPQCTTASQCPSVGTTCEPTACIGGLCVPQSAPEGTPCTDAGANEICNGIGSCVPFTFDVVRIGNPAGAAQGGAAAPVFIEQRNVTDGGLASPPIALPPSAPGGANQAFVETGTALGVGLNRSTDGHTLSLVGYAADAGTGNPANNASAPAVVALVGASGTVDTSTVVPSASFNTLNALRSAVSADGGAFWVSGSGATPTGGVWYVQYGTARTGAQLSPTNVRTVGIFGGQLYGTGETASGGAPELFTVGSGVPTSGTQALTALSGLPTSVGAGTVSPWQFVLLDMVPSIPGLDTLYIANDTAVAGDSGVPMGIQRWSLNTAGTSWSLTATLELLNGTTQVGFRGLTGINVGGTATLIASTAETANRVAVFTDDAVSSPWAGTVSVVVAAPAGGVEYFRGIALSPH